MTTTASSTQTPDLESLRAAIQEEYRMVALEPQHGFHFHTGRRLAHLLGYPEEWLIGLPESSIASFAGTGNPFSLGALNPGDKVVDIGSGAGFDSLIAARMVSPDGQVVGIDMTPAMIEKAKSAAQEAGISNVEFRQGYAETLPIEDGWADVVISNGVLNLIPDKPAALQEMARILKPSGRLQIGDILVQKAVPESAKRKIDLWTGWIAGALLEAELKATVVAAGFVDFEITWQADVFGGAPQSSSAASFGTLGINFRARKPADEAEWAEAFASLTCETEETIFSWKWEILTSERRAILEQIQSSAGLARGETAGDLLAMIVAEHKHLRRLLKSLPNPEWLRQGHHPLLGVMSIEFLARRVGEHATQIKAAVGGKSPVAGLGIG